MLRYSILGSFLPGLAQSRGRKESWLLLQVSGVRQVATEAVRGATTCCSLGFPPPEPVDKVAAVREFRVLHTALHSSPAYRDAVSGALRCPRVSPRCQQGPVAEPRGATLLLCSHFRSSKCWATRSHWIRSL